MSWQIDPNHSHVEFSARHMMISKVRGQFKNFSGIVDGTEADPTKANIDVQIEAASIDTRNDQRDVHLRSADFLDAEQFPYLTFKSKRVEQVDATHGRLVGDLTIRDVTHEVTLQVEYAGEAKSPWGMRVVAFNATTKINRKDWGLNWNMALETGGWLVGEEITIDIELELIEQADQAEETAELAATA